MRVHCSLAVFVCLFLAAPAFSQRVHEASSGISLAGDEAVVSLAVESDRSRSGLLSRLELLDTADRVKSIRIKRDTDLSAGMQTLQFRLPISAIGRTAADDIAFYRLRYTVGDAGGIVSVSQLLRDLFELRVVSTDNLLTGMTHRTTVRAVNPFSGQPLSAVKIDATVELELRGEDHKKLTLNGSGLTNAEGVAAIDIVIPAEAQLDGDGELSVTGSRNGIVRKAVEELQAMSDDVQVLTMTDKPIYQPGQTLNLRCITLKGSEAKTVLTGTEIEFRITDEDDTLLYREKVMSSAFGIAAIGWQIPANAKLGNYQIGIRDGEGRQIGGHSVKVTRYDLPNFAVTAKPSKPYYLPADKVAEIEVRADFLFGKPVTKGKVRVVEETSREWNWKEQ